jgi:UDP-N-acetylglucosamine/UDP-N-acetylgalactosamine 4-epimerase
VASLVTGVGYIGTPLVQRLLALDERVVGLDNWFSTDRAAIPSEVLGASRLALVEGDVADPEPVRQALDAVPIEADPPSVYHLAAQPSAALAARDPAVTERTNLVGARILFEAARDRGATVVFGGSFRVYGDDLDGQTVTEATPYGRVGDLSHLSKIYVEQLARMLGLRFVSVRLGIVYGRSAVLKRDPALLTVPNLFCLQAARGEPLVVQDDRPLAFIHVDDAVRALLAAHRLLTADGGSPWQVVNAATEVARVGEVAQLVGRIAAERGRTTEIRGPTGGEASFAVRSRLDAVGFRAERTLADGLPEVLDAFGAAAA